MTDLETLKRAKLYMENLANGINPLDGSIVPENDVIQNVRLSRCFFYVADVLGQVIENGGIGQKVVQKKRPFELPVEKYQRFRVSQTPVSISELVKQINDLTQDENMIKLSTRVITDWLVSIEALEIQTAQDGRSVKRPTRQGSMLGISVETRNGIKGEYSAVVYHEQAQQFVLDHLDAALDIYRKKTENQGKPWSEEHDRCLQELYQSGTSIHQIANTLKRNNASIRARLKKLGLTP